jgi:pilus assembly protein CpaE
VSVPATSILLLETDPAAGDAIRSTLTRAGYGVTNVLDVEGAVRSASGHQLVVIDAVGPGRSASDTCRELRSAAGLTGTPVLCISQTDDVEERIRFLEAGADDVIARPFDARELEARVEALMLRFQRSRDLTPVTMPGPEPRRGRKLIAVFSPKGGVGTTTIAVNTALLANQLHPERAVILDLDLQFGSVATHLNLPINNSLADLARDDEAQRDAEGLRPYISVHESGLQVLGAAGSPEYAQLVTVKHVERLLATLAASYDAVIVDAGSTLDERSLAVFELAECIIIPIVAELGALRAVRTMLDYLNDTGSAMTKAIFVLNNMFPKEPLRSGDVETALGTHIALELPYDPLLYVKAINEGVPVVVSAPKSSAADRLSRLATMALAGDKAEAESTHSERRRGFGGLLRRSA